MICKITGHLKASHLLPVFFFGNMNGTPMAKITPILFSNFDLMSLSGVFSSVTKNCKSPFLGKPLIFTKNSRSKNFLVAIILNQTSQTFWDWRRINLFLYVLGKIRWGRFRCASRQQNMEIWLRIAQRLQVIVQKEGKLSSLFLMV